MAAEQQRRWRELRKELHGVGITLARAAGPRQGRNGMARPAFPDAYFSGSDTACRRSGASFSVHPQSRLHDRARITRAKRPTRTARPSIRLPAKIERFIRLPGEPGGKGQRFVALETAIGMFTHSLFPGYHVRGHGLFRVIRDSDLEVEEEAEDLVLFFESALKRRRRGSVIRLEFDSRMPEELARVCRRGTRRRGGRDFHPGWDAGPERTIRTRWS